MKNESKTDKVWEEKRKSSERLARIVNNHDLIECYNEVSQKFCDEKVSSEVSFMEEPIWKQFIASGLITLNDETGTFRNNDGNEKNIHLSEIECFRMFFKIADPTDFETAGKIINSILEKSRRFTISLSVSDKEKAVIFFRNHIGYFACRGSSFFVESSRTTEEFLIGSFENANRISVWVDMINFENQKEI